MKVVVRPIDSKRWHGKKGEDSFRQPLVVEALYDRASGGYATGLTEEEEAIYSKKLNVSLDNKFNPEEAHPTWSQKKFHMKLLDYEEVLETDAPLDFVKWKLMTASKYVANSLAEYESGVWPYATHYIYDEEQETIKKASKSQMLQKCYGLLATMTTDQKAAIAQIITNKTVKNKSHDFIDAKMTEIINDFPAIFLRWAQADKSEIFASAAVKEALFRGFLTKSGNTISFLGDPIGFSEDDAVKYFQDPINGTMKANLLEKLK